MDKNNKVYLVSYRKAQVGEKFITDIGYDEPRIITASVKTMDKVPVILETVENEKDIETVQNIIKRFNQIKNV